MKNATYRFWAGTSLVPKNISWKLGMADRIIQWRIVLKALYPGFWVGTCVGTQNLLVEHGVADALHWGGLH